jgi:succinate dehydrogenase / fumarate reductase, cytochrome b subunit
VFHRAAKGGGIVSAKDRETANVGAGNWKGTGMWAWILFRVSGLILAGYLFIHIWVISQGRTWSPVALMVDGRQWRLDDLMHFFEKPFLVFLDLMLVAAVLYHALNGVRIVLMDLNIGIERHKAVFWVCMVVAALTLSVFAYKASDFIL